MPKFRLQYRTTISIDIDEEDDFENEDNAMDALQEWIQDDARNQLGGGKVTQIDAEEEDDGDIAGTDEE